MKCPSTCGLASLSNLNRLMASEESLSSVLPGVRFQRLPSVRPGLLNQAVEHPARDP